MRPPHRPLPGRCPAYAPVDTTLYIVRGDHEHKTWWRNLLMPATVHVHYAVGTGQVFLAQADPADAPWQTPRWRPTIGLFTSASPIYEQLRSSLRRQVSVSGVDVDVGLLHYGHEGEVLHD